MPRRKESRLTGGGAESDWQVSLDQARRTPPPPGERSLAVLRHGSMTVRYYAPRGRDEQTPHRQDEIYVVVSGSGWFVHEGRRTRFGPGEVLFVPAGAEHRFESFTDDFAAWVVFYGPEGGEAGS